MTDERIGSEQSGVNESARRKGRQAEKDSRSHDDWGDLDQFSTHASRGVLRHMTEDEEKAGLSWEEFRPQ